MIHFKKKFKSKTNFLDRLAVELFRSLSRDAQAQWKFDSLEFEIEKIRIRIIIFNIHHSSFIILLSVVAAAVGEEMYLEGTYRTRNG